MLSIKMVNQVFHMQSDLMLRASSKIENMTQHQGKMVVEFIISVITLIVNQS